MIGPLHLLAISRSEEVRRVDSLYLEFRWNLCSGRRVVGAAQLLVDQFACRWLSLRDRTRPPSRRRASCQHGMTVEESSVTTAAGGQRGPGAWWCLSRLST